MKGNDEFVEEFKQSIEWFCDKLCEPYPMDQEGYDKIYRRMLSVGWVKQHEVDLYKELTKPKDD